MANPTFSQPLNVVAPTPLNGGTALTITALSWSQGQTTLNVQIAAPNVASARFEPNADNTTNGTAADNFLLTNTRNSSGFLTPLANSTTAYDQVHTNISGVLKFSRNGTNNQDGVVVQFTKGS